MKKNGTIVPGLDYDTVSPVEIDLAAIGFFGIAGKETDNCRRLIRYFVHASHQMHEGKTAFYIADSISQGMNDIAEEEGVEAYEYLPAKIPGMVKDLEMVLANRYTALMNGEGNFADEKTLVLILTGVTSFDALAGDPAAVSAFKNITGKYKALKVCVILSELDNASIGFGAGDILKKMKDEQKLFWFGELDGLNIMDMPYAVIKRFKKALVEGDCYFITGSECRKIKTPTI
jgi:S-DNA-T family DNA segregation ATPase FtsK/SpoIIIE